MLLTAFVAVERRVAHPLLPLRVVADRTRGGAYAAIGLAGIAMFALFLFLTYFMQRTLGFSPIQTGLAFLPLSAAIIITANIVSQRLLPKYGPRPHMVVGMLLGAAAMLYLTQLDTDSSYVSARPAGPDPDGHRHGQHLPAGLPDRHLRRRPRRHRRRLGDGQHDAAGRRLDRHRAAELDLRERGHVVLRGARADRPRCSQAATVHGYTVAFWVAAGVFAVGALVVGARRAVDPARERTRGAEPVDAH